MPMGIEGEEGTDEKALYELADMALYETMKTAAP